MSLVTIPSIGRFHVLKSGHIHIRCRRCKKTLSNVGRAEWDHPDAAVAVFNFCERCDTGGEFEDVMYYDAEGNELLSQ